MAKKMQKSQTALRAAATRQHRLIDLLGLTAKITRPDVNVIAEVVRNMASAVLKGLEAARAHARLKIQ